MPGALLLVVFVVAAAVSLLAGWQLVTRIERLGSGWGMTEALLGLVAALAADAPEVTTAVTALASGSARVGAGVIVGSNVFNLAALLGLGALVAGRIALHRRVVVLEGIVAVWMAVVTLFVVLGTLSTAVGLLLTLIVLAPYATVLGIAPGRLVRGGLPARISLWLESAVEEETLELAAGAPAPAIPSPEEVAPRRDARWAVLLTVVVVGASVAMERSASTLASRHAVPEILLGALVLAAVTSLPNVVAAVYLAAHGRGAATLSTAMNSNALNVVAGLLVPGTIAGTAAPSGTATYVACGYLGLTLLVLVLAWSARGLGRAAGGGILVLYVAFAVGLGLLA